MKLESCFHIVSLFFETLHPNFAAENKDDDSSNSMFQECFAFVEAFCNQLHPDLTIEKQKPH